MFIVILSATKDLGIPSPRFFAIAQNDKLQHSERQR